MPGEDEQPRKPWLPPEFDTEEFRKGLEANAAERPYVSYVMADAVLTFTMLEVLTRRLGPEFAAEVRQEILDRADKLAAGEDAKDRADAVEYRKIAEQEGWKRLIGES